jgi:ABC-type transport system involved in cytochrome c biogenesis permease subunit
LSAGWIGERLGRRRGDVYTRRNLTPLCITPRCVGQTEAFMEHVTLVCFIASYALALALELLHQFRPRPVLRLLGLLSGAAGLTAQTIFLAVQRPNPVQQFGWMLYLGWIFAIFYVAGSLHHRRQAWGIFVLPLVLGLLGLGVAFAPATPGTSGEPSPSPQDVWGGLHALLLFLAAVGVCVGFLASLMYLIQAHRLRAKALPGRGLRLLNLERLEAMNRRAINLAFPLLTAGLLLGALLMFQDRLSGWTDPRVLGAAVLWAAFAVLVYLRYGYHLRGRQVALGTILTFVLLLFCLVLAHPLGQGGGR